MSSKVLNIDAVPEEDYELLYDNFLTDFLKGIRRTNITTNTKGTTLVRGVGGTRIIAPGQHKGIAA